MITEKNEELLLYGYLIKIDRRFFKDTCVFIIDVYGNLLRTSLFCLKDFVIQGNYWRDSRKFEREDKNNNKYLIFKIDNRRKLEKRVSIAFGQSKVFFSERQCKSLIAEAEVLLKKYRKFLI